MVCRWAINGPSVEDNLFIDLPRLPVDSGPLPFKATRSNSRRSYSFRNNSLDEPFHFHNAHRLTLPG